MAFRTDLNNNPVEKGMRGTMQQSNGQWVRYEGETKVDPVYLGEVPLSREKALFDVARPLGVPTPEVVGEGTLKSGPHYLLLQNLPGVAWNKFVEDKNFALAPYLASLHSLGETIGRAHTHLYHLYGDAFGATDVRSAVANFADRLEDVTSRRLTAAQQKGALSDEELGRVKDYFTAQLHALGSCLTSEIVPSRLVITNLHNTNFLVEPNSGEVTGIPDMKFSQAGPAALDVYYAMLQQGSYFNRETLSKARDAFMEGYNAVAQYDPTNSVNLGLEHVLSMGHTLAAVTAYHGIHPAKDSLRSPWAGQFKDLLLRGVDEGPDGYNALAAGFADVLRTKTKQPVNPN